MFDNQENGNALLLIDETGEAASLFRGFLRSDFVCDEADSAEVALWKLRCRDYAVVLCNSNSPFSDREAFVAQVREASPHAAIVMIGEEPSPDETIGLFRAGIFDYLLRPAGFADVASAVKRAIEHYDAKWLKDRYLLHLEQLASERATEIDKALEDVETSYRITLKALVQALETRDFETHGHSERVVTFSLRLGHELGLDKEALHDLELGALLHDIGKIGVPDAILRKPGALNEEEWEKMKLHPLHGQKILRNISFLEGAARVVSQHHERWDGGGYPHGIRGHAIDMGARIFAVVDAFDAMVSDRVYRRGRSYEAAVAELDRCAGTQFDPLVVEAFKNIPKEDWEVLRDRSLKAKPEVISFQTVVSDLVFSGGNLELVH